jgi:uncharacterized protein YndB with AHSA1/START domain
MVWGLVIAAGAALAILVMVGAGTLLPRQHTARRAVYLAASPERVWAAVTDVPAFPSWRDDIRAVEPLPSGDGLPMWLELTSHGVHTLETVEAHPPSRLVTRVADSSRAAGGRWEYDIVPFGGGSRVTTTEHGEIPNPVIRFVSHFVTRFVLGDAATVDEYLRALGMKFGEEVQPMPAGDDDGRHRVLRRVSAAGGA